MTCSSCGANIPPGATACPMCGMPVASNQGSYDPTVAAQSPYGSPPSTGYGSDPYPPPLNPYGAPQQQQYGGVPPQPQYGPPPQQQYGPPPMYVQQQPPPQKKSNTGLIVAIVLIVVVLVCGGGIAAISYGIYSAGKAVSSSVTSAYATATADAATFTTAGGTGPSGNTIDASAAAIITSPQTTTGVNNFTPVDSTSSFTTGQKVYIAFATNASSDGYATSKWYVNGQLVATVTPPIKIPAGSAHGYFDYTYSKAGAGQAELYWCTQADCSDEVLADVVSFTIS